ncbi:MAG: DUF1573 domain-containing protein [Flavitalea sp.]
MKSLILSLALLTCSATMFAQTQAAAGVTVKKAENYIKFKELTYDFGKIKKDVQVKHDFAFTNVSEKPIIIESAFGSCGCTTPVWPQAPIAKGKADKLVAGFTAPTVGKFSKTITVKLAGVDAPVQLTITCEVLTPEDYAKFEKDKGSKKG